MGSRGEKVGYLAAKLYDNLVEGDQNRIALSGMLSPTNSLRHKSTRACFSWVQRDISGERLFTQAMVRDAIAKMALDKTLFLIVPTTPGFSEKAWLDDQAKAIHALLKKVAEALDDHLKSLPSSSQHRLVEDEIVFED
ncbi:unnamed protein product, partial [Symbiodinium sp. CCMP2456]